MKRFGLLTAWAVFFLLIGPLLLAAEFEDYPQFRYTSGLPGGSTGVTPDGHLGFAGAFQLNIPIGYTPGWGNFMLVANTGATDGGIPTRLSGSGVNGSLTFGMGIWKKPRIWWSDMGTGKGEKSLEPADHLQIQLVEESKDWPAISIGLIDLLNMRAASLQRPLAGEARSFFIAATRSGQLDGKPIYYTLGWGTDRFRHPFAGISFQPHERWQLFAEYDGWVGNIGFGYDLVRSREWHLIFGAALVDFERCDLSLGVTKTNF